MFNKYPFTNCCKNHFSVTSAIYQKNSLPQISDTLINSFEGQALFHHIPAYGQFFGARDFQTPVQKTLGPDAPFFY